MFIIRLSFNTHCYSTLLLWIKLFISHANVSVKKLSVQRKYLQIRERQTWGLGRLAKAIITLVYIITMLDNSYLSVYKNIYIYTRGHQKSVLQEHASKHKKKGCPWTTSHRVSWDCGVMRDSISPITGRPLTDMNPMDPSGSFWARRGGAVGFPHEGWLGGRVWPGSRYLSWLLNKRHLVANKGFSSEPRTSQPWCAQAGNAGPAVLGRWSEVCDTAAHCAAGGRDPPPHCRGSSGSRRRSSCRSPGPPGPRHPLWWQKQINPTIKDPQKATEHKQCLATRAELPT